MNWSTFYLICFVVGLAFAVLSFLGGFGHLHLPGHWHLPVLHQGGPIHAGPIHVPHAGAGHVGAGVSPFNFFTLMAFLAWFGGTGYLLTQYSHLWFAAALVLATAAGLVGGGIVFLFFAKVVMADEQPLDPADYEMRGVLGYVSSSIRQGGTGEIVYSQGGTRHASGARSEDGAAIAKGSEVVVTRYEKGIAYVRRWEDLNEGK
jgi:membrane protein implicated in regulation of membrane protease activity